MPTMNSRIILLRNSELTRRGGFRIVVTSECLLPVFNARRVRIGLRAPGRELFGAWW